MTTNFAVRPLPTHLLYVSELLILNTRQTKKEDNTADSLDLSKLSSYQEIHCDAGFTSKIKAKSHEY